MRRVQGNDHVYRLLGRNVVRRRHFGRNIILYFGRYIFFCCYILELQDRFGNRDLRRGLCLRASGVELECRAGTARFPAPFD